MEFVLDRSHASDWAYRGEGAANLVLAYSGSSSHFIGKVIRIQKAARNEKSLRALSAHEGLVWKDIDGIASAPSRELVGQLYVNRVLIPLLGFEFVDPGIRVPVSRDFLESVESNVTSKRPGSRVDAAKVNIDADSALLLSDHSLFHGGSREGGPCICVEIKPKCGFLPTSEFIDEGNTVKRIVPRYKMHQALKLLQGEIPAYSEYNPLDLFSGSKDRIYKAVSDLISSPQNNFRVFLDGALVFGTLDSSAEVTDLMVLESFEDAIRNVIPGDCGLPVDNFLKLLSETIYVSGVMDRLLEVQKLDSIDIEGVIHAYYDVVSKPCKVCKELGKETARKYVYLHSIPLDESLKIVKNFLIAATAKDCSLMMSFRPRKEGTVESSHKNVYLKSTDQTFDYKVCFIDLDLKSLKKMEEYYEKDQKIVRCYTQMLEEDKAKW